MSHPRAPGPGRRRAAVLAAAAVLAVLAALAAGAAARHPAPVPPAAATLAADAVTAAPAPPARAAAPAAGAASPAGPGGCGTLDVGCDVTSAITSALAGLVRSAVSPLVSLIGRTALSTPQPGGIAAVRTLWSAGLGIADASYALLVLAGGILVMSHETLQTSYSAKEIAPRIVLGFAGANLSMILMTRAVSLANALSAAFTATGVSPRAAAESLMATLRSSAAGGIFLILLALAGVALALLLAAVYVIRLMAVVLLAAAAPVALALYALPQTAWAARWWWRALAAALAIQAAQALVLTAAVRVFLAPGWLPASISTGLGKTLITLSLLYILARIPFWVARPVLGPLGGSPLRRAARFAVTAAVFSRIAPLLRGGTPPGGRPGQGGKAGGGRSGSPGSRKGSKP